MALHAVWVVLGPVLIGLALPPTSDAGVRLAEDGVAKATIVLGPDASPTDRAAAEELRDHLNLVTAGTFPLVTEAPEGNAGPVILVGDSTDTRALLPDVDWASLGHDGIVIRTVGERLVLAGGRPRGTLYAVVTFLEDAVGVRWWTSTERTVPRRPTFDVPDQNVVYVPPFRYREPFYMETIGGGAHATFATRLRANGHHCEIPPDRGGHYTILGWCHTAYHLLPPERHFAVHPDWYSLRGGTRKAERGQLCWSNPDMRAALVREALAWIAKNPAAGIISISQNDWHGACECDACRAIDQREGTQMGSMLDGINAIAAEIAKHHPDFLVETLAYQYTRKPPKHLRPADNVLIRLCSIEANVSRPLTDPANAAFADDLRAWSKIAKNLFIWNYVTNFANYLIPHPNLRPLAADLRLFAANNVVGVFEQGDYHNLGVGDFIQLRAWVLAHLLWDPRLDQEKLIDDFLTGYYGAAGPHLRRHLDRVNAVADIEGFRLGCASNDTSFLDAGAIREMSAIFDDAEKAVADDAERLRRVRRERLVLEHLRLMRFPFRARAAELASKLGSDGAAAEVVRAEYAARANQFVEQARAAGVRHVSEGQTFRAYEPALVARADWYLPPELPGPGGPLPAGAIDVQEAHFRLAGRGDWSDLVDDPAASDGRAARMRGDHTQWAVQLPIPADDPAFAGRRRWRCYVVIRANVKRPSGTAFQYGLYDPGRGVSVAHETVPADRAKDGTYQTCPIAAGRLRPGMYFWVAPTNNPNVEAVYVDRIYLVPDADVDD